ncbi:MAG: arylsulfotransferase family protein [Thermoanaerobaculia bacterium]
MLALLVAAAVTGALFAIGTDFLVGVWLGLETTGGAAEVPVRPRGFWHAAHRGQRDGEGGPARDAEERARFVALPYLGGRAPAPEDGELGVVLHHRARAYQGLNLYNSGHGPEAILMDMDGRVLHRWRRAFEEAFPDVEPTTDTGFFRRVHPFPDGRLLALYQTGGLVLLDRRSRPIATCPGSFYNDLWVGNDGRIWTVAKEVLAEDAPFSRLDDFLVLLRLDARNRCREERRISLTEAFRDSGYAHLLDRMPHAGDVLHANTVTELEGSLASVDPRYARGNLLVSIRELDLVAIVDPRSEQVLWAQRGPWRHQHEPSLLENGRILLFDNEGYDGFSRLVEVDPGTGAIAWSWPRSPTPSFASRLAGTCSRLEGGNTLITESVPGRAFEIDPEGRILWEFRSPHRAGSDDSLVAMLFEVQRLPPGFFTPSFP